jgi:hypothetical protein
LFKLAHFFHLGSIYGITTPQCQNHDNQMTTAATATQAPEPPPQATARRVGTGTTTKWQRTPDEMAWKRQWNNGTMEQQDDGETE